MIGKYYFINPNLVIQKGDFLGSGIPYMPHILSYTIGLVKTKYPINVIDSFGQNPSIISYHKDFYWQGISIEDTVAQIVNPKAIFIYASSITNIDFNLQLTDYIKIQFPTIPIVILANTQAVTSFDISSVADIFLNHGVDYIIYNNIEKTAFQLIRSKFQVKNLNNIIYRYEGRKITSPMSLEIGECTNLILPAWEEFPLRNYWDLGYSHGPISGKYLPILSSYGCPFHCEFCVNPSINKSRWQAKSPENLVFEIKYLIKKFGIQEFHFEDLDPTIDKKRIKDFSDLLIKEKLNIRWKLVSGTKVETLDKETLNVMKKAGCDYISISPESGSGRILKLMNKPFNYDYANDIIKHCVNLKIRTQACFVLGFPGETHKDINETKKYIKKITRLGIDEIAIFIAAPLPGNKLFEKIKGYSTYSELTFSPKWRKNYPKIEKNRKMLYRVFIFSKIIFHPFSLLSQLKNVFLHHFETKMEMIPYRIFKFKWILLNNHA